MTTNCVQVSLLGVSEGGRGGGEVGAREVGEEVREGGGGGECVRERGEDVGMCEGSGRSV